jgi:hypothetical protein
MKRPRISTLIIIVQFILLLVCLIFLGRELIHNWFLKSRAKELAAEAGFAEATHNFLRGNFYHYEAKLFKFDADDSGTVPTDGTTEPAGKKDGQFQVRYLLVDQSFPKVHREIQQAFVDAYNKHMNQYFEHPEWFDKNGLRIPMHELQTHTNALIQSNEF